MWAPRYLKPILRRYLTLLQLDPRYLKVLRLMQPHYRVRPRVLSKVCEWKDLRDPRVLASYRGILSTMETEQQRVSVDPACCPADAFPSIRLWWMARSSHEGPAGSRRVDQEMVWDYAWASTHLDLRPGLRVADIGTENSCLPFYLASFGCQVYGLDIWAGRYGREFASQVLDVCFDRRFELIVDRGDEAPGRVTYAFADALKLDFATNSFDRIVCLSVIEHIADDTQVVRELGRVLKPGGTLVMTTALGPEHHEEAEPPHEPTHDGRRLACRTYSTETLFTRIVLPSGLQFLGAHDLQVPDWSKKRRHQIPGQNPSFVSAALFLTKD